MSITIIQSFRIVMPVFVSNGGQFKESNSNIMTFKIDHFMTITQGLINTGVRTIL